MKKPKFFIILFLTISTSVFAQETLRYFDPSQNRYITAKVIHAGYEHHYTTISNPGNKSARLLTYGTSIFTTEFIAVMTIEAKELFSMFHTEWSKWELINTEPLPFADVNDLILKKNTAVQVYMKNPILGTRVGPFLRIFSPPINRGDFIWFDENNYLHIFFKTYVVFD
jgi:hypothetical protein